MQLVEEVVEAGPRYGRAVPVDPADLGRALVAVHREHRVEQRVHSLAGVVHDAFDAELHLVQQFVQSRLGQHRSDTREIAWPAPRLRGICRIVLLHRPTVTRLSLKDNPSPSMGRGAVRRSRAAP